jgi:hypothetical protein
MVNGGGLFGNQGGSCFLYRAFPYSKSGALSNGAALQQSLAFSGFPGDEYVVLATEGDKRIRAQDIRQKAEISGPWLVARLWPVSAIRNQE